MGKLCCIDGCEKPARSGAMCRKHDSRMRRHGSPTITLVSTQRGEAQQWLKDHVRHEGEDCLLWPFSQKAFGYGGVWWKGKPRRVTRLMCELAHGAPCGDRNEAAHSCGNRGCVNPKHLRWATASENQLDRRKHGTATDLSKRKRNNGTLV